VSGSLLRISLSALDEQRFGVRVARASGVTVEMLPGIERFCCEHGVELVIARSDANELAAVQEMEQHEFRLMDTLVYYRRSLSEIPETTLEPGIVIRPVRKNEPDEVRAIAAAVFKGYGGHYHADPRLDPTQCDEVYPSWAYRSCVSPDVAGAVLVAESASGLVGFVAVRTNSEEEGEVTLYGVIPSVQGRGVGRALLVTAMHRLRENRLSHVIISTQVTNFTSQRVWVRLGFTPYRAFYTFHKWYPG
jgi:ribosomal protein S18 acetylase RimI-like enzyme